MVRRFFVCFIIAILYLGVANVLKAEPALTVYNQNFGVVRDTIELNLKKGANNIQTTEITAHLEPDSVILRDPSGRCLLQILEQNYRADPISQGLLLSLYEGKTIDFLVGEKIVQGKIIRSGYVPHQSAWQRYGQQYYARQAMYVGGEYGQSIIEVEGKLRFSLPGIPLFPALADDTILKPTLNWIIETDRAGKLNAEFCYVTGGMNWEADYNVIAPEEGDILDLVGWVTIDNQSGKTFENAKIKLMAGDVSKLKPQERYELKESMLRADFAGAMRPPVSEKAFDEYHLYTLDRSATLHDRETKQVEFVRASDVKSKRLYVYDGAKIDWNRYRGYDPISIRENREFGTGFNPKVWVVREFVNSEKNHLGIPLPKGRMRFYRQDKDGQLEFIGEDIIDHTPRDETVRLYTGNAFDLVGERRRTNFNCDYNHFWLDESFEIKLRNHKKEPVEIRVVEHLYRWHNWTIIAKSNNYLKTESNTIEFRVQVPPDEEKTVTYTVHYTW